MDGASGERAMVPAPDGVARSGPGPGVRRITSRNPSVVPFGILGGPGQAARADR